VPDRHDFDGALVVVHCIKDAIISTAQSVFVPPAEFSAAARARLGRELHNGRGDSIKNRRGQPIHFLFG